MNMLSSLNGARKTMEVAFQQTLINAVSLESMRVPRFMPRG